jgi:glutamate synthase domain-containing protein 2
MAHLGDQLVTRLSDSSQIHRENGGDIIWEIGSGYFSCRNPDGTFCAEKFEEGAKCEQVKMVELKLSQGAKRGHGGVLPAAKVSREIAAARGVPAGVDCISPARHSAFSTPIEMMQFMPQCEAFPPANPLDSNFVLAIRGNSSPFARRCWKRKSIRTLL